MNKKYSLIYCVTFDGESPVRAEECMALIEAPNFRSAYEKALERIKKVKENPTVFTVEVSGLTEEIKLRR